MENNQLLFYLKCEDDDDQYTNYRRSYLLGFHKSVEVCSTNMILHLDGTKIMEYSFFISHFAAWSLILGHFLGDTLSYLTSITQVDL